MSSQSSNTETAAEHVRNALMLFGALKVETTADGRILNAGMMRLTAALERLEEQPKTPKQLACPRCREHQTTSAMAELRPGHHVCTWCGFIVELPCTVCGGKGGSFGLKCSACGVEP